MTYNLRHWSALGKTDPSQTKSFQRAGGFKGTATKPIWNEMRLTEHFGPCGVGWGCDEPAFTLVPALDELMVFCTLRCWFMEDGKQASLYGVGGDKVVTKNRNGLVTDDEAYKKAFTDALGNAFKHVGINADIHMGMFEDSKYVASMKREFADQPSPDDKEQSEVEPVARPQQRPPAGRAASQQPPATPFDEPPAPNADDAEREASREDMRKLLAAFKAAPSIAAIEDGGNGLWAVNKAAVMRIANYGGQSAMAMLSKAAADRIDQLRSDKFEV